MDRSAQLLKSFPGTLTSSANKAKVLTAPEPDAPRKIARLADEIVGFSPVH